ncbi:hypothetical protein GOP47_0000564 [Adiantum capillus-veneris]|uniref:Mitochondrial carrier protein n=1 Tax=Adiantum capillus-veneris TaxID=13818 RepID=A0A9D4VE68_ADICA|nr:hypothetical protein GOP47_0000564 [Adiantum capillus-veneris]
METAGIRRGVFLCTKVFQNAAIPKAADSAEDLAKASRELYLPADVHWDMLDKSKFFILGAALFSGVSATFYPVMVLKTRQQVSSLPSSISSFKLCGRILQHEGLRGLYRGFSTSLLGTIPARVLYMSTLEITKSILGETALSLGFSASMAATSANAVGGLAASVAAQLVWTPVDVISQRLMVQGNKAVNDLHSEKSELCKCRDMRKIHVSERRNYGCKSPNYKGGLDALRCIIQRDGWRGLYRGFGMSIITYAPSNALWWGSYCVAQRTMWGSLGYCKNAARECSVSPTPSLVFGVQSVSAACAGGVTALLTTPLDTIKTRLQVENTPLTTRETIGRLIKEGGWRACYKGLGPRWSMMAMSAVTMITTYEFLKRSSTKQDIRTDI